MTGTVEDTGTGTQTADVILHTVMLKQLLECALDSSPFRTSWIRIWDQVKQVEVRTDLWGC